MERIFSRAKHERFESGYDSVFSLTIEDLVYNKDAAFSVVKNVREYLYCDHMNGEIASEALCVLGRIKHEQSHSSRLRLLTEALSHEEYWVRDGATIGLSHMEDSAAIPYLEAAAKSEDNIFLRKYILLTAKEINEARSCDAKG